MLQNLSPSTGVVFNNPSSGISNYRRENPDETLPDERVKLINRFFQQSHQHQRRQEAVRWWQESDRLFNGEHWHNAGRMDSWKAKLCINLVYPVVEKYLSLAMEMIPQMEVLPREPEDHVFSKTFDKFFMHEWEQKNWAATFGMAVEKAIIRNIGFLKMFWDIHGEGGRGGVHIEAISAYDLYFHPDVSIRDGKVHSKFAIHRFRMTREQIINKYNVDPIRPLVRVAPQEYRTSVPTGSPEVGKTTAASGSSRRSENPNKKEDDKDGHDVYELWYMDDTRVETAEFDPIDGRTTMPPVRPLMYPNGRIITMANETILYDGPNQLGFFPFVALTPSPDTEQFYRKSMINHLASPQHEYNKRRSQISDHASLVSNPPIEINIASQIDTDTPLNQPGRKFVNHGGGEAGIRVIEVPKLGPEVMQALMMAHQDIQEISGIYEVARGEEPSGDQSGVAIERLQSEGKTRTSMRQLFLDQGFKTVARNIISMLLDFVSDSRKFMYIDSDSQVAFDEFNPVEMLMPRRMNRVAQIELQIQEVQATLNNAVLSGEPPEVIDAIQRHIELLQKEIQTIIHMPAHDLVSLDVKISMGTRNMSKSQQISQAVQLHQTPSSTGFGTVIDDQALLQMLEVPGWQEILARQQQAAMIMAEEMAKAEKKQAAEERKKSK